MTSLNNPILAEGRTHLQHVLQCRNLQVWYDIEIWHSLEPGWYRCFARASSLEGKLLASEFLDTLRRLSGVDSDGDEPVELVPYSNKTQLEGNIPHPIGGPMIPGTYVFRCVKYDKSREEAAAMRVGNMGLNSLDNTMLLCPQHSSWMDRSYISINPKTRRLHAFHPIARDFHGLELRRPFAHANEWLPAPHVNMLSWHFDRSIIGWTSGHGQFVDEGIRKVNEEDSSDEDSDRDDVRSR
ncbi:hypothetical protein EXIGLDRAFT_783088 [Exidia glandulosa HHB12029]|uniref:Uncharacterized protein n=1 Tax=Exidia glandulosa HHB12029 TaxID=1314781 RepID=A0A165Z2Y8_EXIGL|nr:hypothetical protein EXIGLDRAFT_783088 [Exidia glandulosa HHB12029]